MSIHSQLTDLTLDHGIAGKLSQKILDILAEIKSGKIDRKRGQAKIKRLVESFSHEAYTNKTELLSIVPIITDPLNDLSSI